MYYIVNTRAIIIRVDE